MQETKPHPNTEAVLDAWRRLSGGHDHDSGPTTDDYPGLVGRLFVLSRVSERDYPFRRVGHELERLFGRALDEHNFLSLWNEPDRFLVSAALGSARADRGPALVRARGETLDGRRLDLEFALAPLLGSVGSPGRFLGVCQSTTPDVALAGRPLRRLRAIAVYPPAPPRDHADIRLVSSR
ncbi:MAG: PAS domain-containing protein [Alphaproteobacteria bacterium]|nr:PAS domain-containing protein [Alphaproteobacteria bacterium]